MVIGYSANRTTLRRRRTLSRLAGGCRALALA